jgi:hypothetical protein
MDQAEQERMPLARTANVFHVTGFEGIGLRCKLTNLRVGEVFEKRDL